MYLVEDVFKTEGVPEWTFVEPPNYNQLLIDVRSPTKPVIIEGQSGSGKTATTIKMVERHCSSYGFKILSGRKSADIPQIIDFSNNSTPGRYIIDDFHRLDLDTQAKIANIIKIAAENSDNDNNIKVIIIGINKVGSNLIYLVHDIAKRCGIHRIEPGNKETIIKLVNKGEEKLDVSFLDKDIIFAESRGDYWLTQLICQAICLNNEVLQSQDHLKELTIDIPMVRYAVINRLDHTYSEPIREFCRGKRFRTTNDPYFKLLKLISEQDSSIVDLKELANANPDVKGSINNVKDRRLPILLESKPLCERYFYYNSSTNVFAIEDPALFYFLKHTDWAKVRKECGFRDDAIIYDFDFAISFAGENRELARILSSQLEMMDCSVFFDELFEANFLGKAWHHKFEEIFAKKSRFVICLLDKFHLEKIWPTFERECFEPRVTDEAVIPIYLDDSSVPGIPKDIVGINLRTKTIEIEDGFVTDNITFKLLEKLDSE